MLYTLTIDSPVGRLRIRGTETVIDEVLFDIGDPEENTPQIPSLLHECAQQLEEYFSGKRLNFDLPLQPEGTAFQQKVWMALRDIPFGKTESYLGLSRRIGDEKAIRAVGLANGRNPIAIIIPCHRVIGSDGSLTGYGGGLWRKEWLLRHEGIWPKEEQLKLF